jgi:hypothetical protein
VPLPYRQVSVQPFTDLLTETAIKAHLLGKDSYRRTRYVILEQAGRCAIAAVERESDAPLFSPITAVDLLAPTERCHLVENETVDTGSPSALAAQARALELGPESTLVVRGMYGHVNFIHRPDPLKIRVVEVTPPEPPKLLGLAQQVLGYAEGLPAIELEPDFIDFHRLASQAPEAEAYLIPCRASGLRFEKPTYFLDEHPERQPWTLIACERSRQIHRHMYGDEPPRVEMCPGRLKPADGRPTILKCCLLEEHIEVEGNRIIVPWGANLAQVEEALQILSNQP